MEMLDRPSVQAAPESSSLPLGLQEAERDAIRERRAAARCEAKDAPPIGLALSGGGIRSATFSLGVLQSLARADLLRRFDYLSTVSGGGYIGSFLGRLLSRTTEQLRKALVPPRGEAAAGTDAPFDLVDRVLTEPRSKPLAYRSFAGMISFSTRDIGPPSVGEALLLHFPK